MSMVVLLLEPGACTGRGGFGERTVEYLCEAGGR